MLKLTKLVILISLTVLAGCGHQLHHTPMQFSVERDRITAIGEVDSNSLNAFENVLKKNPNIRTLVLKNVGGSVDDEANIEFSRVVRELGFVTIVPSDGLVASGGTDLFLAGVQRILEAGACVGVHTWATEDYVATDLPRTDPEHDPYLAYYDDIGIDQNFYWFTLEAAPADNMHWMSDSEVAEFKISTSSALSLGSAAICEHR
ncbi:COG3904 family protein [Parasphingorhabdus cellanae]|uniref:Alpha/beta hydrolase n=1 Tax=Parasphingorhabdus cellanae TaxID=2806553 RepID=A0ABX7TA35_9SPHN|nr:hypothetical protein [Parasphingorhabdus cellanae]QTD57479.1 hypothetical protein J4G78_08125 [Parasphingorhabdus cellanae]